MLKKISFALCAALLLIAQPALAERDFDRDCGDYNTQAQMNECAAREYKAIDKKLNAGYKKALGKIKSREMYENFRDSQRVWIKYRDSNCDFAADMYKGGSMEQFVYYNCMERLTDDRYEEISDLFRKDR